MIGERIHQRRLEQGLSLSELAEKANIAKSYLSAIERSIQVNPSIQVIEKLASVLNVPIQSLIHPEHAEFSSSRSIDEEWILLAKEAVESGISKEQFREWLEFQRWRKERSDDAVE